MFILIFAIVYFISSTFLCQDCIRINLIACKVKKILGEDTPRTGALTCAPARFAVRGLLLLKHPHFSIPSYATGTGQKRVPPKGLLQPIVLCYLPDYPWERYAKADCCFCTINLPVMYSSQELFNEALDQAVLNSGSFYFQE